MYSTLKYLNRVTDAHEDRLIDDLLWNADGAIDYDTEKAIRKLVDFHEEYTSGLEVDDIIDLINVHTDSDGVEYIINEIKEWVDTDKNEVTIEEYTEEIKTYYSLTNKYLKELCSWKNLPTSGTKDDLVQRLIDDYLSKHEVKVV